MPIPSQVHERRARTDRRRTAPHPVTDDLRVALEQGDVEILFQPQFRAADGMMCGAEALARWEHQVFGWQRGDALVAIAQSGGFARQLSQYIASAALHAAARWPEGMRLSLNITAMDLHDAGLVEDISAALDAAGFAPERLTLEITEQALVADLDRSAKRLRLLADKGIAIALDDFGAGYCNFRYLKLLPLHALKLDRSMIEGIASDPRDLAVLRGILAMARALDLRVIAEGIETEPQREVIAAEGCEVWQGFLGGKPMAAADLLQLDAG